MALDKVLPHRDFMQILQLDEYECEGEAVLEYDAEWLAILRSTMCMTNTTNTHTRLPNPNGSSDGERYVHAMAWKVMSSVSRGARESKHHLTRLLLP